MPFLIRLLCLLPLLGAATLPAPDAAKPKAVTVYLVRHAEKGPLTDPQKPTEQPLSAAGEQRAQALRDALRKEPIVAVYCTDTKRTRDTAAPLASARKLNPESYVADAPGLAALATRIRQVTPAGKAALVVGHSNTVLETIEALGAPRPVKAIGDDEFSYLFEVKLPASGGPATATVRRYGAQLK
ncbi:histidine phosphatase family protein [Hymenobacter sp. 15J16-1T3B]|uniref:histidine phosphatase family protein n=1 Tax=Hymenobacter sp. 15J16-1T3B TaxID=2886941 RepID=UPI001D123CCA|nr:histidine phosphatase family protein [Hymenobacter sp. 15J16-1T3B]MCC3157010.1 histidine phosphatase family protein [Hymenobacter sp. 15J16-1T3B]